MSVEAAIRTLLTSDTTVNNQINGRIGAAGMPQGTPRPYAVYQRINTKREYSNDGSTGMPSTRLQVTCNANDYATAKQVANAVRDVLDGYRGTVGSQVIDRILLDDERDAPSPLSPGQDTGIQGIIFDVIITFHE